MRGPATHTFSLFFSGTTAGNDSFVVPFAGRIVGVDFSATLAAAIHGHYFVGIVGTSSLDNATLDTPRGLTSAIAAIRGQVAILAGSTHVGMFTGIGKFCHCNFLVSARQTVWLSAKGQSTTADIHAIVHVAPR